MKRIPILLTILAGIGLLADETLFAQGFGGARVGRSSGGYIGGISRRSINNGGVGYPNAAGAARTIGGVPGRVINPSGIVYGGNTGLTTASPSGRNMIPGGFAGGMYGEKTGGGSYSYNNSFAGGLLDRGGRSAFRGTSLGTQARGTYREKMNTFFGSPNNSYQSGMIDGGARSMATSSGYGRFAGGISPSGANAGVGPHRTRATSPITRRRNAADFRNGLNAQHPGYRNWFGPDWQENHPGAWRPQDWREAIWTAVTWNALTDWWAWTGTPYYYDYGNTVAYEGDAVYYDNKPVASAQAYYDQASVIAKQGKSEVDNAGQWKSLGVWGMLQGDQTESDKMIQLAVNKDRVVRGNYYDTLADTTAAIQGAVDPQTQRMAFTIGSNTKTVYETGIYNMTQDETSLLVHFDEKSTQQWTLVRFEADVPTTEEATPSEPAIASPAEPGNAPTPPVVQTDTKKPSNPTETKTEPTNKTIPLFSDRWFQAHPKTWHVPFQVTPADKMNSWANMSKWFSIDDPALAYNYGDEFTIDTTGILWREQLVSTQEAYTDAAVKLAEIGQGKEIADDAWATLGVFQLEMEGFAGGKAIMQLAAGKSGMLRGTLVIPTTNDIYMVKGALDKRRQRVAFTVAGLQDLVFDMGLSNLAQESTSLLVHSPPTKTIKIYSMSRQDGKP